MRDYGIKILYTHRGGTTRFFFLEYEGNFVGVLLGGMGNDPKHYPRCLYKHLRFWKPSRTATLWALNRFLEKRRHKVPPEVKELLREKMVLLSL